MQLLNFLKKKVEPIAVPNYDDKEYLKNFILRWELEFPVDKWLRDKYKIPFNSPDHRKFLFFDIALEYEEHLLFEDMKYVPYKKNTGDWIDNTTEEEYLTESEKLDKYKEEFKNIDLSQYND